MGMGLFYYEQQIKRELKGIHTCGCSCNERLQAKTDGSTRLAYTQHPAVCLLLSDSKKGEGEGKESVTL